MPGNVAHTKTLAKGFSLLLLCVILSSCSPFADREQIRDQRDDAVHSRPIKLYWFIPDGMRADPELFNIYEWAEDGELPNIKKLMDGGTYGYSVPVFPSHTPVNFATLLTGSTPKVHGVADGPMHLEGKPLDKVAIGGFSSAAKKVDPIWTTMEQQGKDVFLLSMPGSTPPELEGGHTIRGRWGGWGADFASINFESSSPNKRPLGIFAKLFLFGPELTKFVDQGRASGWDNLPRSFSEPIESSLVAWGTTIYVIVYDDTDDLIDNYNRMLFSIDKKRILADLPQGEWSSWQDITLKWQEKPVESHMLIRPIIIGNDGFFRVRIVFDALNKYIASPEISSNQLQIGVGPMIDFVDNFPPQLIYYDEDKQVFLEEMQKSFEWHTAAIPFILKAYQPDVVIHDVYNPNQMLTSRWWMGSVDPASDRYLSLSDEERERSWTEVKQMYRDLDGMIGKILENTDENTLIVISSDHGAIPLNKVVRLNNLFAKEGLLFFTIDEHTGISIVDWNRSKVVYMQMDNIYISPHGLGREYNRSSGEEYERLREQVRQILFNVEDENGVKPLASITNWEDVENFLDLPKDRVGDFIIANEAGYGWSEEMTPDLEVFSVPLISGYKQAVSPQIKGMWTPFIIYGPGVRQHHMLQQPISHIDQYPTIMKLMGMESPNFVEGRPIGEAFK